MTGAAPKFPSKSQASKKNQRPDKPEAQNFREQNISSLPKDAKGNCAWQLPIRQKGAEFAPRSLCRREPERARTARKISDAERGASDQRITRRTAITRIGGAHLAQARHAVSRR
jgi:hypothetical protein